MSELTVMRGVLGRLRKWIRATREDGFGPMGTDLETLRDIADVLEADISELEDELNTAELDNEYLREQLRHIEQLERENGYMRLPVDADGVPIKPGDTVTVGGGEIYVGAVGIGGFNSAPLFCARDARHVQPDTVESALEELVDDVRACVDTPECIAEYAERIRKAVEHEG